MAKDGKWDNGLMGNLDPLKDNEKQEVKDFSLKKQEELKDNLDKMEVKLPKFTGILNFQPTQKWVVIGRKKKTKSNIIIHNTEHLDSSSNDWALVIACGPECTQVKPGDLTYVAFQNRPTKLEGHEDFDNDEYTLFLVGEYDFYLVKRK